MTAAAARGAALGSLCALLCAAGGVHGDDLSPPWVGEGEVPPPAWARSVVPRPGEQGRPGDLVLFAGPSRASGRRGVTAEGASLPFFGQRRGEGCDGSWWLVGPLAWACSDDADLAADEPSAPARMTGADGLSATYGVVRGETASAYSSLESAQAGEASEELEGGWSVAVVAEKTTDDGARWALTTKGLYVAQDDLAPVRPSRFHGEAVADGRLDFGWIVADRAAEWAEPATKGKPAGELPRFQLVHVSDGGGPMVRVDGGWVLARDVAWPRPAAPPIEVKRAGERWIDVDLATQTLVAYEGARPVYATLVSTGRGAAGEPTATPPGVHRVWVKLAASDMSNVERDDGSAHYSLQDVPYVQFFDDGIALHGTYWHGDFGRRRSHGCVNLAPLDARWLFDFTEPRMPAGWIAAYPAREDDASVVRVR